VRKKGIAHRALVGQPEGKRTLGRFRRRWKDINNVQVGHKVFFLITNIYYNRTACDTNFFFTIT